MTADGCLGSATGRRRPPASGAALLAGFAKAAGLLRNCLSTVAPTNATFPQPFQNGTRHMVLVLLIAIDEHVLSWLIFMAAQIDNVPTATQKGAPNRVPTQLINQSSHGAGSNSRNSRRISYIPKINRHKTSIRLGSASRTRRPVPLPGEGSLPPITRSISLQRGSLALSGVEGSLACPERRRATSHCFLATLGGRGCLPPACRGRVRQASSALIGSVMSHLPLANRPYDMLTRTRCPAARFRLNSSCAGLPSTYRRRYKTTRLLRQTTSAPSQEIRFF